jgi:processive 1,2-diacylglycerol beta-glucosyltransferase
MSGARRGNHFALVTERASTFTPPMRILILTAAYGEGHNAAARGLHAAFGELGAESEIVDLFAITGGAFYERSRRDYITLINRAPKIWAFLFRLIDRFPVVEFTLPALAKMQAALADLLTDKRPDAVLSVYPVYGYLIEKLFPRRADRRFAFHTVVTDSITINSVWHRCASDTFLVPNEDSAHVLHAAGLPPEIIHATGFPVPPRFADPRPPRPAPDRDLPGRVLFIINAGKDRAPAAVERLLRLDGIHLTVTIGRDETLRARLEEIARHAGREIEIHGWTDRMPELVMSHHLLIGKAGGATVQEAIAARTPMLITQVVPGQEEGNAQLLFQNGCGELCETPEALAAKVQWLFANDAAQWRRWEENIARISKPDAARSIARFVAAAVEC